MDMSQVCLSNCSGLQDLESGSLAVATVGAWPVDDHGLRQTQAKGFTATPPPVLSGSHLGDLSWPTASRSARSETQHAELIDAIKGRSTTEVRAPITIHGRAAWSRPRRPSRGRCSGDEPLGPGFLHTRA